MEQKRARAKEILEEVTDQVNHWSGFAAQAGAPETHIEKFVFSHRLKMGDVIPPDLNTNTRELPAC
ncbi:MAG: hypothetical protein AB8B95_08195 [Pseudohongiellaceae bacterium]